MINLEIRGQAPNKMQSQGKGPIEAGTSWPLWRSCEAEAVGTLWDCCRERDEGRGRYWARSGKGLKSVAGTRGFHGAVVCK